MALKDFTGQNIKDTFQRVIQTDGTNFADGTGSIIPIALSTEISGAFADESASFAARFDALSTSYTDLTDIPVGIVSASNGHITSSGNISASGDIIATNVNAGVPTSNNWGENLEGSYFNNFNASTDVSEILRFMAGILSESAANPTPNTKTYSHLSENKSNTTTTSAPSGRIPQDNDIPDLTYLIDNGFASEGGTLFSGISPSTIYTNTGYSISYSSNDGGSTSVGSDLSDTNLFGLGVLDSGNASAFKVSGSHIFKFYRSQTAKNTSSPTETSSSGNILTNSSFGTSNGLTIAKINTVNPAVIPAAFQDGKFASVHLQNLVNWTTEALTSVSASGYYEINTTIGIATGSQSDFTTKSASETIFWAPITNLTTNIGNQTLGITGTVITALTLTSASLSGAPYVTGGTWNLATTASGVFEPMYAAIADVVEVGISGVSGYTISKTSGNDTLSTVGGIIKTSGMVTSADGATVRAFNSIPHRTDLVEIDAVYSISGTGDTVSEARTGGDTQFQLIPKARNRSGGQSTLETNNVKIHEAGTFGQPATSGSMKYFGGGASSTTDLIERFFNETYRRVISDSTTLDTAWNPGTNLILGDGSDLQVKPGYLVNPESSNGYWYVADGYNANHYKWYLREFDTGATSNKGTLTINLDPNSSSDLVTFDSTTGNKIAVGVIFGSSTSTVFDAVKGNQSYGGSLNSTANGAMNPFSDAIDIKGDFSSITNSSGTLTLGLNNAGGQTINGTHDKIWLLIRYKGTPSNTLEKITVSTS